MASPAWCSLAPSQTATEIVVHEDVGACRAVTGGAQEGYGVVHDLEDAADCLHLITLTDLQVSASTFDRPPSEHTSVAERAIEIAKARNEAADAYDEAED